MVVNTPLGLYQYQRLPYGIASAPAIFQRYLEQLIQGIEGCGNYLDDIIITAPTFDEHMQRVENILQVLQSNGIKFKQQKCFFLQEKIEYLGRQISAGGILPDESGLVAVRDLKPLKNIKQVEAFMGKVNYYHNFIPNFSQISAPINMLRRKNVPFTWGPKQQQAFTSLKEHILNATQLAHYDEQLPLVLATDASSYGIGAVLSHTYPDGSERPIAFASKTLDKHQVRYSQIEKEGLSIIFGVKRFHQYLYGRPFTLITDHKPLVSIFNPSSQLPTMTSHRLQRWAITLMSYKYDVKYRKTTENGNADALSRLPLGPDGEFDKQEACLNVKTINTPIDPDVILKHAGKDAILRRATAFVKNGWPEKLPPQDSDLRSFFNRKNSLTIINNLLCFQAEHTRVVIPASSKQQVLQLLHDGHWGTSRMKQLARQHVWWVDIDNDIAKLAAKCDICKAVNPAPAREYEADTISALAAIFAIEGIPNTLVSDNGPQLTSEEFKTFCAHLGIKHLTSAPFHPASNGLAERFVRTFKSAVKKNVDDGLQLRAAVTKYLSTYRSMPNAEGKSPAEILHGRPVRTLLSQIFETSTVKTKDGARKSKFCINEPIFARNYAKGEKWLQGIITRQLGKMLYVVKTSYGYLKRHVNQLKSSVSTNVSSQEESDLVTWVPKADDSTSTPEEPNGQPMEDSSSQGDLQLRRSARTRQNINRYEAKDFRK
ncbi:uncharacterized protein K02A2.6-like [Anastrepha obliqua]|uniref:uncharacterized protein K02A2.6-like n=1 Tax=Anastrepha obliqua TaxID=95512 RepID=UPI002409E62B|nr:uncharacterized protein K02A2.6-like [Anastrepha obliqua]XP_054745986.1 uncharacterized protein K02A2.6-like [Anastrepha obliqua]